MPLLREDSFQGRYNLRFDMEETEQMLENAVHVEVQAHLVPYLAFERYNGMDSLNRSYMNQQTAEGNPAVPFIETMAMPAPGTNEILTHLGIHAPEGTQVNTAYIEAYNAIVNFRRTNRSKSLKKQERLQATLADCFWNHTQMRYVVPDFDQARIDGAVALSINQAQLPVTGISRAGDTAVESGAAQLNFGDQSASVTNSSSPGSLLRFELAHGGASNIFAQLAQENATLSLADIETAKETRAFAQLRTKYGGHSDEYLIDLLMSGIHIPDLALQHRILVAAKSTVFGYAERFATDSAGLDKSLTNGMASVDLAINIPPISTGGIIMINAAITPQQLFERQKDYFFFETDQKKWPEFTRDYLDPEKVEIVQNNHSDVDHTVPNGTFGYAPLNHGWNRQGANVGGKYLRPKVNAPTDEIRQRIWAVETVDPSLSDDWYLCTNMHHKPFKNREADVFEIVCIGEAGIRGNTVFGAGLAEATDDYQKITEKVDFERITKPAAFEEGDETGETEGEPAAKPAKD